MKYNIKGKTVQPRYVVDLLGCDAYARLGASWFNTASAPPRGNRFEIDPDLEPARTADMREDKGKVLESCSRGSRLRKAVAKCVKLLRVDCALVPVTSVPTTIECGGIRKALRSMYSPHLSLVQELSIKTSSKLEVSPCKYCENLADARQGEWESRRFLPCDLEEEGLKRFERAFSENVPEGWDRYRTAYVPNGHASLGRTRCEGGNWNLDPISDEVEVSTVMSSGKARVITLYSSGNVGVLTPLHNSLYRVLKRRKWLLVGSPTSERLRELKSTSLGTEWLSFDYESATDNIKTAYVRRAVKVLKRKAGFLSPEEIECLDVFSRLQIDSRDCETGQPMGSPMSFPLLCLINKTVVDLSVNSLLEKGEISFKEWTSHRCMINGDDLLMRSTSKGDVAAALMREGSYVGLRTNIDKTMRSETVAEINSTAFVDFEKQKKTNLGSIHMTRLVNDVIGFADESTSTTRGFLSVVCGNAKHLAKQDVKLHNPISKKRRMALVRDKKIQKSLRAVPSVSVGPSPNLFPVVDTPQGFKLSEEEVRTVLDREVARIRSDQLFKVIKPLQASHQAKLRSVVPDYSRKRGSVSRYLHVPKPGRERVLRVLARYWEEKRKEELRAGEPWEEVRLPPTDLTRIEFMLDLIKTFKDKRNVDRPIPIPLEGVGGASADYVSLSDG